VLKKRKHREDLREDLRRSIHVTDNRVRQPNSSSNIVDRNPFNEAFSLWARMWRPSWLYAPDTETTTLTGNVINMVINKMKSKNRSQEREIVENVASYGKQLGRISDALDVLIPLVVSRIDASDLKQDERRALENFSDMVKAIAKVKGKRVPPDGRQLDLLFGDIRDLKGQDDETYQNLLNKLRDFAETESRG